MPNPLRGTALSRWPHKPFWWTAALFFIIPEIGYVIFGSWQLSSYLIGQPSFFDDRFSNFMTVMLGVLIFIDSLVYIFALYIHENEYFFKWQYLIGDLLNVLGSTLYLISQCLYFVPIDENLEVESIYIYIY
jgi:hypothetical protein